MMRASHPERRTPTFRQFTMVLAAVTWFALLLPVGARATASLVTLVDPQTSVKAHVDEPGALRVAEYNEPARLPVRRTKFIILAAGVASQSISVTTVPDGYELVIDTVSAYMSLPTGQQPTLVELKNHQNGYVALPMTRNGSNGVNDYYGSTVAVQLYSDPGDTVSAIWSRTASAGPAPVSISINGHLVPL
ncbi:MAG TPA: hypothetical protein VGB19_07125 [Actinomycetota bacterium]